MATTKETNGPSRPPTGDPHGPVPEKRDTARTPRTRWVGAQERAVRCVKGRKMDSSNAKEIKTMKLCKLYLQRNFVIESAAVKFRAEFEFVLHKQIFLSNTNLYILFFRFCDSSNAHSKWFFDFQSIRFFRLYESSDFKIICLKNSKIFMNLDIRFSDSVIFRCTH